MRATDRAAFATSQEGWPFASLVLATVDHDATPLLLMSDLSEHAKNIKRERKVSLLFDGTAGLEDPLTGPRVTVLGVAEVADEARIRQRFLSRHPAAGLYAGFGDFHLYRVRVTRAHLVAGFGRIHWIESGELVLAPESDFAAAESAALAELNEAPALHAALQAGGLDGEGWRITGLDPEGLDFRRAGSIARSNFETPLPTIEAVRAAVQRGEFNRA
jgi:hypothetical protein